MKPIERFALYCKLNKIRYSNVERNAGIANGYLSKQVKNSASIGSDILERICNLYPGLNPAWLLTGRGEPNLNKNELSSLEKNEEVSAPLKAVSNEQLELYRLQIANLTDHIDLLKKEIKLLNNTIDLLGPDKND